MSAFQTTGCIFCGFGAHLEKGETRFQRLAKTHPKLWAYCINDLKMGAVLDAVGVEYRPDLVPANVELTGLRRSYGEGPVERHVRPQTAEKGSEE